MKKNGLILVCVLMMVSACGWFSKDKPKASPEPTRVVIEFESAEKINPNIVGRSSPVVVRIYQLTAYSAFKDADFISLLDKGDDVLGQEFVKKQEIILQPDEERTVFFETSEDVRTIGILAAFRYYHQGQWKIAANVEKNKTTVVRVLVSGTNMKIK